jgi:hypothetical protein
VARVRLPKPVVAVVTLLAGASLYIYLTHYAVFPALLDHLPLPLVVVASLAVGVVVWQVGGRYQQAAARWCRRVFAEPVRLKGRVGRPAGHPSRGSGGS